MTNSNFVTICYAICGLICLYRVKNGAKSNTETLNAPTSSLFLETISGIIFLGLAVYWSNNVAPNRAVFPALSTIIFLISTFLRILYYQEPPYIWKFMPWKNLFPWRPHAMVRVKIRDIILDFSQNKNYNPDMELAEYIRIVQNRGQE